jgi:hypothetical protein
MAVASSPWARGSSVSTERGMTISSFRAIRKVWIGGVATGGAARGVKTTAVVPPTGKPKSLSSSTWSGEAVHQAWEVKSTTTPLKAPSNGRENGSDQCVTVPSKT